MSQSKTAVWQPFETAPKDGTELIFWISSQKGFRTQQPTSILQRDNGGGPTQKRC